MLALGTFCLFYGSWYTEYLAQEKNQRAAVATATVVLLLLHRCVRMRPGFASFDLVLLRFRGFSLRFGEVFPSFSWGVGAARASTSVRGWGSGSQVQADDFHANSLTSAKAVELFLKKFGDLVEVPPTTPGPKWSSFAQEMAIFMGSHGFSRWFQRFESHLSPFEVAGR